MLLRSQVPITTVRVAGLVAPSDRHGGGARTGRNVNVNVNGDGWRDVFAS